jgi:MYXO-CTERM domain-containing protein
MRRLHYLPVPAFLLSVLLPLVSQGAPWLENKTFFSENASRGSSMVDAADLDGDGYVDLVFANGNGYDKGTPDSDQVQQAFHNDAGVSTTDITDNVFGPGASYNGRAIKLRDIDGDDDIDIVLGTTWGSQSQLLLNDGLGSFSNETAVNLPQVNASIGDLELGDVDGDGDLDIVLADWGQFSPVSDAQAGGITQLWTQMDVNTGMFEDTTLDKMPNLSIRWSWDLELVDVNNDYNLDLVISCFACDKNSVYLFANDGDGGFSDVTPNITGQGAAALDVEPVDLDGDNFLDLVTLHDATGGRNRVLINTKNGGFEDKSDLVWPKLQNPSSYDHMVAVLDYDSNGLPDLAVGALQPGANKYPDRLMMNNGGKLSQNIAAFEEVKASAGTYAIVLADFNLDRILDMAMSQNENANEKKVFLGTPELLADTAPPRIPNYQKLAQDIEFGSDQSLKVRAHDNKTPVMPHDFQRKDDMYTDGRPYLEYWSTDPGPDLEANPGTLSDHGVWYGEALWKISFTVPDEGDRFAYRICAIDAAHNKACTPLENIDKPVEETSSTGEGSTGPIDPTTGGSSTGGSDSETGPIDTTLVPTTAFPDPTTTTMTSLTDTDDSESTTFGIGPYDDDGCGCDTSGSPTQGLLGSLALLGLLGLRRRRHDA